MLFNRELECIIRTAFVSCGVYAYIHSSLSSPGITHKSIYNRIFTANAHANEKLFQEKKTKQKRFEQHKYIHLLLDWHYL